MDLSEETLRTLSCDIKTRPSNAPGCDAVMPSVRKLRVQDGALIVSFDQAAKVTLQAFVEAERLCCTSLTWKVTELGDAVELQIQGTPEQLSVTRQWFDPSVQEAKLTDPSKVTGNASVNVPRSPSQEYLLPGG